MRIALAYAHYDSHYAGGLLRRAARRLGLDVVTIGPKMGRWIENAPPEPEDETTPDFIVPAEAWTRGNWHAIDKSVGADVLVNVDQGEGFYCRAAGAKVIHLFTEGNDGEYERARDAHAVWSLMPLKPAGRAVAGLLHLQWGYDPAYYNESWCEHTKHGATAVTRDIDVLLTGTWSVRRQAMVDAVREVWPDCRLRTGPPVSRLEWHRLMWRARAAICDHDEGYLSGRVVDAMACGCLVAAKPSLSMEMLAPGGYLRVPGRADDSGKLDPVATAKLLRDALRGPPADVTEAMASRMIEAARSAVAPFTWDNQLRRLLASVGVWL